MGRALGHMVRRGMHMVFCWESQITRWEDNIKMDLREIGWGGMN
jgi:hypothetical protein